MMLIVVRPFLLLSLSRLPYSGVSSDVEDYTHCDNEVCRPLEVILLQTSLQLDPLQTGDAKVDVKAPVLLAASRREVAHGNLTATANAIVDSTASLNETSHSHERKGLTDILYPLSKTGTTTVEPSAFEKAKQDFIEKQEQRIIRELMVPAGPFDVANLYQQIDGSYATWQSKAVYYFFGITFVIITVSHDIYHTRKEYHTQTDIQMSPRFEAWDAVKFFLVGCVLFGHTDMFMENWMGRQYMWWALPYGIAGLVFVTGVFSATPAGQLFASTKSYMVTLVGIPCTLLLFDLMISFVCLITPGIHIFQVGRSGVEWYLECMMVWRPVLPFMFNVLKKIRIPGEVTLLMIYLSTYCIWVQFPVDPEVVSSNLADIVVFQSMYPWRLLVVQAPFFALGMVRTPEEWQSMFSHRTSKIIGCTTFAVYSIGINFSPLFRSAYDTSCVLDEQCKGLWFPVSIYSVNEFSLATLAQFSWIYLQRTILILALVPTMAVITDCVKAFAPITAKMWLAMGTRTFYGYLLHWVLWIVPACRCGVKADFLSTRTNYPYSFRVLPFVVGPIVHMALCSRLSEYWFGFLLKTPQWIAEAAGVVPASSRPSKAPSSETIHDDVVKGGK